MKTLIFVRSFSEEEREALQAGLRSKNTFTSVEDLRQQILAFIEYFNRTMAKPFKWTYKGRPLKV